VGGRLREFIWRRRELLLIVLLLLVVAAVLHWIPYKLAFLNFFYLPVLAAGYLLGARRAIWSSVLCVLLVVIYYIWLWSRDAAAAGLAPEEFWRLAVQDLATVSALAMWGGFLVLAGAAFGLAHEKMVANYDQAQRLNARLELQAVELRRLNDDLEASSKALTQHADELQEKSLTIEKLKQQVEEALYSTMDATVARLVIQGRLREEKRSLSVLFCDLEGFTSYAQGRRPEVVVEDLNEFYAAMEVLVETYHGHIDKYLGDGLMAEFGAPIEYEQHCLHAAVAALKMQEKARAMKLRWPLRVGLASGDSVVGLLGRRRRNYSVIGASVNLAKRLEEMCEAGSVFMDATTFADIQHLVAADKIRSFGARRAEDVQVSEVIRQMEQQIIQNPGDPGLLFKAGMLCFRIREASRAMEFFRRALELEPENNDFKLAFADASLKRDEYEKISIPGLKAKLAVYKVLRLRDPLLDRERFPENFCARYTHVRDLLEIPDDFVLPTEVIDGTVGHSESVAVLCYALADRLGLPDDLKRNLMLAGRLQDLGKSVIWHHILNRRVSLSEVERKELQGHVQESVGIARRMGFDFSGVTEIIAGHHELLDGSGYPRGLKGDEIPLSARIACVADVYCALTSWRAYRAAWDRQAALSELRKGVVSGHYDAVVVDALSELLH